MPEILETAVERPDSIATKPLNYVMVRHMGYSPLTRVHRALSTRKKSRFQLMDGRRIPNKGYRRMTEVMFEDVLKNLNILLSGVRDGHVQVCRPDNLEPLTLDQLADLGTRLAKDFEVDLEINETLLEPLTADQTDKKVWVEGETKVDTGLLDDKGEDAAASGMEESAEETEEEEGWTEEALMKLNRTELNKVAAEEYNIAGAEELPTKKAVVEAIFAATENKE